MTSQNPSSRSKPVTIAAVARHAGVSVATVSRVLSRVPTVEAELARRVIQASDELGYLPSGMARNLRRGRSHTIGLVLSDISNSFFGSIVRGVEDVMAREGSDVVIFNTDNTVAREAAAIQRILEMRMDGVIVSSASAEGNHFDRVRQANVPLVFVNREPDHVNDDCVVSDNLGAAEQAVTHLLKTGHRKIGLVGGPKRFSTARSRHQGYESAFAKAAIPLDHELVVVTADTSRESGYAATAELLKRRPDITAIFVTNNTLALGVVLRLGEMHIGIPKEMMVITFDNPAWAELVGVSTIVQPVYEMGEAAAGMLSKKIAGLVDHEAKIVLKPQLVLRLSSLMPIGRQEVGSRIQEGD